MDGQERGLTMLELQVTVGDLRDDEVPGLGWAGGPGYCESVAQELAGRDAGLLDYLAVRGPAGLPIAVGGVRFDRRRDSGTIYQLSVMPLLQSCGVGTLLITALEHRARDRGASHVDLGVTDGNPRARALYERLGYVSFARGTDKWTYRERNGAIVEVVDQCTLLFRDL
ncbi:MAG TPA: GNAT family N-acetyltransferase [Actinomycetes bacterium]|nr:GNAT family N-acetyltransferase [Actinomycetes bacterium]